MIWVLVRTCAMAVNAIMEYKRDFDIEPDT